VGDDASSSKTSGLGERIRIKRAVFLSGQEAAKQPDLPGGGKCFRRQSIRTYAGLNSSVRPPGNLWTGLERLLSLGKKSEELVVQKGGKSNELGRCRNGGQVIFLLAVRGP